VSASLLTVRKSRSGILSLGKTEHAMKCGRKWARALRRGRLDAGVTKKEVCDDKGKRVKRNGLCFDLLFGRPQSFPSG
jgi:hypothetical protein